MPGPARPLPRPGPGCRGYGIVGPRGHDRTGGHAHVSSPSRPRAGAGRLARAPPCRAGERRHPIDGARQRVQCRRTGERRLLVPVDLRRRPLRRLHVLCLQPRGGRHERRGRHLRARPEAGHDGARERVQRRGAGERTLPGLRTRRSPPTAASSPSSPGPPTSWRATRTARATSSCATGSGARRARERVQRRGAGERLAPATRRSPPTAASSPSSPGPPTSWRATRTARRDIFVRDRSSGTTELVSVSSAGEQANGDSGDPSISADGRFVAFASGASNLVAGDTNGTWDIFVRDRKRGTTRRVSVSSAGKQANGRLLRHPSISADGRFVAFVSSASNLVAGDTNRAGMTSSCATAGRARRARERVERREAGERAVPRPVDLRRRPLRRLRSWASNLVAGDTNGTLGRLRARPEAGHDETRERVERREAGERRLRRPVDLRRRPLRRLRLLGHQPGRARYERQPRTSSCAARSGRPGPRSPSIGPQPGPTASGPDPLARSIHGQRIARRYGT